MEYKALTQNTSTFTKTTTITTSTVLSDPLRYMFGTMRCINSDGTKSTPYIFAPCRYQTSYSGSKPYLSQTDNSYDYDPSLYRCEVDGVTYYGTKEASFYSPVSTTNSLKGIIKVIMYSNSEGTIVSHEYNVDLRRTSTNYYRSYLLIPKLSEDIILSITFEEAPEKTSE